VFDKKKKGWTYLKVTDTVHLVCNSLCDFFNMVCISQVIKQVSCGAVHVVALSEDGLLQAWGNVQPES